MRKPQIIIYVFSVIFIVMLTSSIIKSTESYKENELETIEANIRKALVTCYVTEGYYPSSLDYLKDSYGLTISSKVNVFYQATGSNIFPDFMVAYKEEK